MMRQESDEIQQAGASHANSRNGSRNKASGTNAADGANQPRDATRRRGPRAEVNADKPHAGGASQSTRAARENGSSRARAIGGSNGAATVEASAPTTRQRATRTTRATTSTETATGGVTEHRRNQYLSPENTIFVSLWFEGPDVYSAAGGLGTRVTEFTESLAQSGYETHLIFVGDPTKPANELLVNGKLHLEALEPMDQQVLPQRRL